MRRNYDMVEDQVEPRRAWLFWIDPMLQPDLNGKPQPNRTGVWLVRSAVIPDRSDWRGIEAEAVNHEDPLRNVANACEKTLGRHPRLVDQIGLLHPGDLPGVDYETYVFAGSQNVEEPATVEGQTVYLERRRPFSPMPGISVGLFPIDDLPTEQIDPEIREWLSASLANAVRKGMDPFRHAEFRPREPYPEADGPEPRPFLG